MTVPTMPENGDYGVTSEFVRLLDSTEQDARRSLAEIESRIKRKKREVTQLNDEISDWNSMLDNVVDKPDCGTVEHLPPFKSPKDVVLDRLADCSVRFGDLEKERDLLLARRNTLYEKLERVRHVREEITILFA